MSQEKTEARLFCTYLTGRDISAKLSTRYAAAIRNSELSKSDTALLAFAHKHPWSIGFIDSGLIFYKPESEFRRRIYLMFAILEASPDFTEYFLAQRRNFLYIFIIALSGIRGVLSAVLGSILVRVIK